jgi:hypothetical protein
MGISGVSWDEADGGGISGDWGGVPVFISGIT